MKELQRLIDEFAEARDWGPEHTPKQLALAIASEVGELCHLLRWSWDDPPADIVGEELADVMIFSLRFCSVLGLDAETIIRGKAEKNERKYPVKVHRDIFPDRWS